MNPVNTEKLIKLVGKYPELYDARSKDYGDLHKRETTWQCIAKELNVKAEVCKAKWNILRGGYRRALRNKEVSYGGRKWRFEDDMNFLKDCVMERRRQIRPDADAFGENAASDNDNEEEFITIVKAEPNEISYAYEALSDSNMPDEDWANSCGSTALNDTEQKEQKGTKDPSQSNNTSERRETVNDGHSIRQFFISLADTVKTLPAIDQVRVKAEVFKAVNMAELHYLQEKAKCKCEKSDSTAD